MSLLKAEHLSVKEGSKEIVKDVNWEINSGENWVLFGLNGCGKTTLLSRLAGYLSPSGGKVFLFGQKTTFLRRTSTGRSEVTPGQWE